MLNISKQVRINKNKIMNQDYQVIKKFIIKEEDENLDFEWVVNNLDKLIEDLTRLHLEQPKASLYLTFYIMRRLDRFNRLDFFNLIINEIAEDILNNIENIPIIIGWDFSIDLLEDYLVNTKLSYSKKISSIILNLIVETLKNNRDPLLNQILYKLDKDHSIHRTIYELWGIDKDEYFNCIRS